ncbi:hypothetical protein [Ferrovibrio sp.]|uniref:hypothetical protein n=1 Tax=Ferrovibrio sp. TaxID=1917215 RepID=UPI00311D3B2C
MSDRISIRTGLGTLVAALLLLAALSLTLSGTVRRLPVFGPDGDARLRQAMTRLTVDDTIALKANHGRTAPRYDIGLFGNSRSVAVSHSDLGVAPSRFFNFSVGGTVFEQSVTLAEHLARDGKLPGTVLISLDNVDIGFFGTIGWPSVFTSLPRIADDSVLIRRMGHASLPRIAAEPVRMALDQVKAFMNADRQLDYLRFLTGIGLEDGGRYRADGSVPQGHLAAQPAADMIRFPAPNPYHLDHLALYVHRLARLQAQGRRIIVYESPLYPPLLREIEQGRKPETAALRQRLFAACHAEGLTCLPAPVLRTATPWPDCCHAPAAALGRFLHDLLPL